MPVVRYKVFRMTNGRRVSCFAQGKYQLEYKKGTVVTAPEGTVGILTFETREDAFEFSLKHSLDFIKVRPIGRGVAICALCASQNEISLDSWYLHPHVDKTMLSSPGTIAYKKAVEVLE